MCLECPGKGPMSPIVPLPPLEWTLYETDAPAEMEA